MPSRTGFLLIALLLLLLVLGILGITSLINRNQADIAEAEARRLHSYQLADELRQSSDDLTRMARTYVVTGDAQYKAYFDRILAIRDGEAPRPQEYGSIYWDFVTATGLSPRPDGESVALEELMRQANFTEDEFSLMRQAKANSDALAALEEQAMSAVVGLYPDDDGSYVIRGEPDLVLAQALLHGDEYHLAKAEIMAPIDDFIRLVDARTAAEVNQLQDRGGRLSVIALALAVIAGLVVVVYIGLTLSRREQDSTTSPASDVRSISDTTAKSSGIPTSSNWPLIVVAVVIILAIVGFTWWTQSLIGQQTREDTADALATVLNTTSESVGDWFDAQQSTASVWAHTQQTRLLCTSLLSFPREQERLLNFTAGTAILDYLDPLMIQGEYEEFLVLAPDGFVLAASNPDEVATNLAGEIPADFFPRTLTGPEYTAIALPHLQTRDHDAATGSTATMLAGAGVRDSDGVPVCTLALRIDPEQDFTQILQRGRLGQSGESYAFNRSGQLISESRFDDDLRLIDLIPDGERGILNVEIRDPGGNLVEGYQPDVARTEQPLTLMAQEAIGGRPGTNLDGYNDYRGVPVVGAWTWDEAAGLGIATEMDAAEAYASLRTTNLLGVGTSALTVVLIIALTGVFVYNRSRMAKTQLELQNLVLDLDRARQEINEAKIRLEAASEGSEVGIWDHNLETDESYFSPSYMRMLGYKPDEFPATIDTFDALVHPDDLAKVRASTDAYLAGGNWESYFENEFRLRAKDGRWLWILSRGKATAWDESGRPTLLVGTNVDITERKEMEVRLEEAMHDAEAANRAKSTFLANMSHELRTPMNAIIGYSEMLAEDAEDEGYDELIPDLEKINSAGRHLLALINEVLDLSKIEAGHMELYLERFDLRQVVDETVSTAQPIVVANNNEFVTDFAPDLGNVRADLTKVRQALFNLLSNAAKFTQDGTVTLTAGRESRRDGDWIVMNVTDTGIGIPEDKLDLVFEEFSQADDSTTRDYGGTGLGLHISRRFCQMMGGDINVASQAGIGSTFTIELPAEVKASPAVQDVSETVGEPMSDMSDVEHPILVIDDDVNARELLLRTLEDDGHLVVTASGGEEGLDLARRLNPSLITLDIMMPGMDGWAVLRALKADADLRHIPVVMISIVSERDLGYSLGAVESLTKPVDRKRLLELVRQFGGQSPGRHALIVEDDEGTRALMRRVLAQAEWTTSEAENGAIALDRLAERRPDLILLDLMMPVMDGFEFVQSVRQDTDNRSIPIIVVTAKELTDEDRRQLAGGVEHIIDKGAFTQGDMLQQLRDLVSDSVNDNQLE